MAIILTPEEARTLIIRRQFGDIKTPAGKKDLLKIIENIGYIQIDTMSVVERSHHHVLWSRMNNYDRSMLDELHRKDKMIFEYWSHAAAYLPMKDFRYSLPRKKLYRKKYKGWETANKKIINHVLRRIKNEGPLQSKDFEGDGNGKSGWWDWKPSKDALDFLFHTGKLMISHRAGFQKVYDLKERVLPSDILTSFPTEREYFEHLINTSVKSHGIISENEINYLRKHSLKPLRKILNEKVEAGELIEIFIKGKNILYYSEPKAINNHNFKEVSDRLLILSPFDNLIIQRKRLKEIFDYDFQIECYLPASKRKFGYFFLPVTYGNEFICKFDAKADRLTRNFIIHKIFWEDSVRKSKKLLSKFENKLNSFAKFTGCDKVTGCPIV